MIEFQEINEKFKTFQKIGAYILTSLNYFFTSNNDLWQNLEVGAYIRPSTFILNPRPEQANK